MIHETGYWDSKQAEKFHIHSPSVSKKISEILGKDLNKRVYDLGCGTGNYLYDLKNYGFTNLVGYEADPILKFSDILIKKGNLTESINETEKGNVISLEVGEHIPQKYQDIFLDNITKLCDNYLIFSWAIRGQGGHGHVNCLNNDEILPLVLEKGFTLLEEETKSLRDSAEDYCRYFRNTLFVLKKTI